MDLEELSGRYEGARIGVLGSGPTLNEFKDELYSLCDVVIACNGSVMALDSKTTPLDFFLYGDKGSPSRAWFKESAKFRNPDGGDVTRILPNSLLPYDDIVLDSEIERHKIEIELLTFLRENHQDETAYRHFVPSGHIILHNGVNYNYGGSINNKFDITECIFGLGSITGMGSQIALRLGASKVNLFGCGFSNGGATGVYAYDCKGEPGTTLDTHVFHMDEIIRQIQDTGVRVTSYGETNLNVPTVIR